MRKLVFSILLSVAGIASATPVLKWLNHSHDFGIINEDDGLAQCTFKAVNVGDEPVVVIDSRANCGCTKPTYNREPVAPGDTLVINVAYNPSNRPGKFNKQVKITTNTEIKTKTLIVRGTVLGSLNTLKSRYPQEVGPYRINNDIAPFGSTIKGRTLASGVQIYNPTTEPIKPVVVNKPEYINVVFKPQEILPGDQGIMSMTAYTDKIASYGTMEDIITLLPSQDSPNDSIDITTIAVVREDFSKMTQQEIEKAPVAKLSETTADFGVIDPTSTKNHTIDLTLSNLGKNPLIVHQIHTNSNAITIASTSTKINGGKSATISITLNPTLLSEAQRLNGIIDSNITITINDPKNPTQIIRVVGQIK